MKPIPELTDEESFIPGVTDSDGAISGFVMPTEPYEEWKKNGGKFTKPQELGRGGLT